MHAEFEKKSGFVLGQRPVQPGAGQEPQAIGGPAAQAEKLCGRLVLEAGEESQFHQRGGGAQRLELDERLLVTDDRADELLAVHEALEELERHDAQAAALVKLRFFAGLEHQEAADLLGLGRRAADRLWLLARTWLYRALAQDDS